MANTLVTLFYGPRATRLKYLPLFKKWLKHHTDMGLTDRILVVTNCKEPVMARGWEHIKMLQVDTDGIYDDVIRQGQPFDVKGAIMCALLKTDIGPFLMLDNDAFLRSPECLDSPELKSNITIGMNRDLGALLFLGEEGMYLYPPYAHVMKRCAGVAWFGEQSRRGELVDLYIKYWKELCTGGVGDREGRVPWQENLKHLLEQHAWSYAAQTMKQPTLADSWNWPMHHKEYNEDAAGVAAANVYHYFGHRKWAKLKIAAPANV